jgi:PKD repeat protein
MYTFNVPGSNYPASWDFGDSTSAFGYTITHVFTNPGLYAVCMNINDSSYTCSSCISIYVSDSSIAPTCRADFYASTSALVGYFIPTGNYNTINTDYSWYFGDGGTSAEAYPYHEYTMTGLYNVCLTVSADTCSDTQCQNVFIPDYNPYPQDSCFANFIISQANPFEVSVVNISSGNNLDFIWTLTSRGGTTAGSGTGAYPVITIDTTGAYILCLTVTNSNGCSAYFCDSLYIGPNGLIGGKVSATGFTIRVVSPQTMTGYSLGIKNAEELGFTIYPNPFSEVLTISAERNTFTSYRLYAVDGKKVEQGNFNSNTQTINTSNLHNGIYLLKVIDVKGISKVLKLVKN